jgi:hypothetical protein
MYFDVCRTPFHDGKTFMADRKRREIAERVFDRNRRRETEINEGLKQEAARHAAVVKNMQRLRALRLAQNEKATVKFGAHINFGISSSDDGLGSPSAVW